MIKNNLFFEFFAPKLPYELIVAIPSSLLEDCISLKEKTTKLGFISRAFAIFKVNEVIIYKDYRKTTNDTSLIRSILEYEETPQYLRKRMFPLKNELRFVGLLPPLRTPHHTLIKKYSEIPEITLREGVVIKSLGEYCIVDVGLDKHLRVKGRAKLGSRVTVLINKKTNRHLIVNSKDFDVYWGYKVNVFQGNLKELKEKIKADLIIATSRRGKSLWDVKVFEKLKRMLKNARKVLILFGAPKAGLFEICNVQRINVNELTEYILNFIPYQGTYTVRTEEAIFIVLAITNLLTYL